MKPAGQDSDARRKKSGDTSSFPRHHSHAPQRPRPIMAKPMPTMRRKAKNGHATGGRSSGAKSFSPLKRPSREWVTMRLAPFGIDTS